MQPAFLIPILPPVISCESIPISRKFFVKDKVTRERRPNKTTLFAALGIIQQRQGACLGKEGRKEHALGVGANKRCDFHVLGTAFYVTGYAFICVTALIFCHKHPMIKRKGRTVGPGPRLSWKSPRHTRSFCFQLNILDYPPAATDLDGGLSAGGDISDDTRWVRTSLPASVQLTAGVPIELITDVRYKNTANQPPEPYCGVRSGQLQLSTLVHSLCSMAPAVQALLCGTS